MPLDKGGGPRGGGGSLSDAADTAPANPADGRSQVDYSIGQPLSVDAVDKLILSTADRHETTQYEVLSIASDFLTGFPVRQGERVGGIRTISKAHDHQVSPFDGETIDGKIYIYFSAGRRTVYDELTGLTEEQVIYPPYRVGEIIYGTLSNIADGNGSLIVDINAAGRTWKPYAPRQVILKAIQNDYLECKPYENGTEDTDADTIYVAKPHTLQRTPWDGETINGVSYVYSDSVTRVASKAGEDDEDQIVVPSYIVDFSVLTIGHVERAIPLNPQIPLATKYVDLNADGRAWAVAPE